VSENPPDEKQLETTSFVIHATRGVIRDPRTRRRVMMLLVILAVVFVIAGFTILQPLLDPHEHPWRVIGFWLVCVWLTFTAILIALFDLLMVRLEARRTERELRDKLKRSSPSE
jgi:hypothetical protein